MQIGTSTRSLVVGYAPANDVSADDKAAFWDELHQVVRASSGPRSQAVLMIDANASLGSLLSEQVGSEEPA